MLELFLLSCGRLWTLILGACSPARGSASRLTPKRVFALTLFLPLFLTVQAVHWLGFLCDEIFFPKYRQVRVRKPIFILGVPRSGTTHLHRVLADDPQFTTMQTWECLLAPSITERKLIWGLAALDRTCGGPLARLIAGFERRCLGSLDAVHPVRLTDPEEDFFVLTPILACFLLVVPFPTSDRIWRMGALDRDVSPKERRRILRFYHRCLQKHLYTHGLEKRLLSKNASFAPLARALIRQFPDARIVACLRDPLETVPSQLSSIQAGLDWFDAERVVPDLHDRLITRLVFYYQNLQQVLDGLPQSRRYRVRLADLRENLEETVRRMYRRFGLLRDEAFGERLTELSKKSRTYRSDHSYCLQDYGWSEQEIAERFRSVYRSADSLRVPEPETCRFSRTEPQKGGIAC